MTKINKAKVENAWLRIMRMAKVETLRREIEIISQNHERDVDRRDALLQMLDRDLEEAEDQFQHALHDHLLNLDRLIELQDSRLSDLEKAFQRDLQIIKQEFESERQYIEKQHEATVRELHHLIETVTEQENEKSAKLKGVCHLPS
ncbi:DRC2 [Symbiodinium sp. KB8]|nr:DRC2 [Symbiodinium sp. KB8]